MEKAPAAEMQPGLFLFCETSSNSYALCVNFLKSNFLPQIAGLNSLEHGYRPSSGWYFL